MDPFQVSRPVHSHLSSLSIPIGSGKHHEHERPPHLPSQHPIVRLKSGRSGSLGSLQIQRVYGAMDPFQVSRPVHSHLSSLSIPIGSGKHHEHERPPHLPSQHPIVRLKSGRSGSLAHSKSNAFMVPWTPSKSLDPFTHICPPFPYP